MEVKLDRRELTILIETFIGFVTLQLDHSLDPPTSFVTVSKVMTYLMEKVTTNQL